jgi:hypothetical protein
MKVILCDFCKKEVSKSNLIKLKKITYKRVYDKVDDTLLATDVSVGKKIEICKGCYNKMIDYIIENCAVQ